MAVNIGQRCFYRCMLRIPSPGHVSHKQILKKIGARKIVLVKIREIILKLLGYMKKDG